MTRLARLTATGHALGAYAARRGADATAEASAVRLLDMLEVVTDAEREAFRAGWRDGFAAGGVLRSDAWGFTSDRSDP
jgi:hypothetical protein